MALDPYSRFSLEYEHTPQEIVQELIAATYSFNNTVADKAINGSNDHVSLYPPNSKSESFPITPDNGGILAREPLFCINSDSYGIDSGGGVVGSFGEMDRQVPEFPEVMSSVNLVNLRAIFDTPMDNLRGLVERSAEDRELSAQLARIVQATLSFIGLNRSKEIGPNTNPGTRSSDSVGTVALSGKLGLDIARHDLPLGVLVEMYVPSLYEVINNEVWKNVPRLPSNLRGKITLWARPFDPQRQACSVITILRNSDGVKYSEKKGISSEAKKAAKLDPDTKAADALIDCINTQFSAGFLAGFHHFAVIVDRITNDALELAAPAPGPVPPPLGSAVDGVTFLRAGVDVNPIVRVAITSSDVEGRRRNRLNVAQFKEVFSGIVAGRMVKRCLPVAGIPTHLGEKIGVDAASIDRILSDTDDQDLEDAYTLTNFDQDDPNVAARAVYISKTAEMKLHQKEVWKAFVEKVPDTIGPLADVMKNGMSWVVGRVTRAARAGMSSTWSMHMS